jgi:hypothetical protein
MSRSRASAVLAALVTMVAMVVGAALLTPAAASAAPKVHYPPPPPTLVVNHGVVKYGVTVHATGRRYASREKVYVTVYFRAKNSHRSRLVKVLIVRANRKGGFVVNVKTTRPGQVLIQAVGKSSHRSAIAFIFVIDKKKHTVVVRRAAFTTAAGPATPAAPAPDTTGMVVAGLGVLALAGSAVFARQTVRRRRRVADAA